MNIGLIVGGKSEEREISLKSAYNVKKSLEKLNYDFIIFEPTDKDFFKKIQEIDIVFNCIHGDYGEDGKIQGFLETLNKKYTCSDSDACYITYDKYAFYEFFKDKLNLPKTHITKEYIKNPFENYPVIIKQRKGGSSNGVFIAHDENEYSEYLKYNLKKYNQTMIQEYIKGEEYTISVLENSQNFITLPYLKIKPKKEFYDYQSKYTEGFTNLIIDNIEDPKIKNEIEKTKNTLLKYFNFKDIFRIDIIIKDNKPYILEINTVPGLTNLSDLPTSANAAGIDFTKLVEIIINNHI